MDCPKCDRQKLRPVKTAIQASGTGATPHRCDSCGGFWIRRSAIPALQRAQALKELEAEDRVEGDADRRNGVCPEGHGILGRAKVKWREPYYLERCVACDGVWLDAGEWNRLSSDHVLEHLDELWLPGWRDRLQKEQSEEEFQNDLRDKLGKELFDTVKALGTELAEHEHGDVGLAYLREFVRIHGTRGRGQD